MRIEDDLVITVDGYENLTTAPKGEEALSMIRRGSKYEYSMLLDDDEHM